MVQDLKHSLTPRRLRNLVLLRFLLAAAVPALLHARITAESATAGPCGSCHTLNTIRENFDTPIPPALPARWLATSALGPPPLWVSSDNGIPTPPADTAPNA